jgi:very-short-patch-repair endonuclease
MTENAPNLLRLFDYIEQAEKLKAKPAFTVPTEFFVAWQADLTGLPEVRFNLQAEGDDVWLRIPRLPEVAAPEPDEALKPWVILPKSPEKQPELRTERVIYEGRDEVGREQLAEQPEVQALFDWYIAYQWTAWSAAEAPRRRAMAFYTKLFGMYQAIAAEGAETPLELAWGIGCAAWKKEGFATAVRHPLIVQSCEVTLDEKTLELEVRPRDVDPRLEVDCYAQMEVAGVPALEGHWQTALATGAHRVNPFESATYQGVLHAAVANLDPSGGYEERTNDVTAPVPGEKLRVTNTWVLFGRKRSGDIFMEDIRRLKQAVKDASTLPLVVNAMLTHGDTEVRHRQETPFRGLGTSSPGEGAHELFFPMAYNDEQVAIIQKLHANEGVVVQGPPGTGKTHTIANVVCHYLALGKRVLVTSKGESALAVVRDKLPEAVRPLAVALLSDERDGMKQFEHSIQLIASTVAGLDPSRSERAIAQLEGELDRLHARIAQVDGAIGALAQGHLQQRRFQGRDCAPEELARLVLAQAEAHQWFDDEPPETADGALPVTDEDIVALRRARMLVREDLGYAQHQLPTPAEMPGWTEFETLHRDLVRARVIDTGVVSGDVVRMVDGALGTFEAAQALLAFLGERLELKARIARAHQPWSDAVKARLADLTPADPVLGALTALLGELRQLHERSRALIALGLSVPADVENHEDFVGALERLVAGKSAFALPFGKGEARGFVDAVKVEGSKPASAEAWKHVAALLDWRRSARRTLAKWGALAGELSLPVPEGGLDAGFRNAYAWQQHVEDIRRLVFDNDAQLAPRVTLVFGPGVVERMWKEGEPFIATLFTSLQAHVERGRLAVASSRVQALGRVLEPCGGPVIEQLREFLTLRLGAPEESDLVLQRRWEELRAELVRLDKLVPSLRELERIATALARGGAPKWTARLRTEPAGVDSDALTPGSWRDAWAWRQAVTFLDGLDGHHTMRERFAERHTLTNELARTYRDLVAQKTWLAVHANSPPDVRQALQGYLNAVSAMGSGTGVKAVRFRKNARAAMERAHKAVPCWVLPHWRVSETIPAQLGLFDLVIVDEASQSDIFALPALVRGKKLLVVGDHKQVSPSAVGTAEDKVKELVARFLDGQPHGSEMTPDKSIYDLARVVFADNSVMLKEHFRCVPAIIEFSNREFYEGDIRPLRVPAADERLDPPLVDVLVRGGHRRGDVNRPEAKAIVDEILSILADPQLARRTIGVVTLLGTAQAALIHEMVSERISPADIVTRKIAVGPPPVFQGRERDIMLISMVLEPGDNPAPMRADMQQRFNVALSRARDRMYLFRSVQDGAFREESLNGRVIAHFKQPFRRDAQRVQALRDRCESGFEREMFDELVKRGYRVQPQVPCGAYRIDFVVEGAEGRRLAVECDGDRYHGPGQWQDDMARQRVLERAGWTFWRCFASSFVRRRTEVLDDLMRTLHDQGIQPLGSETVDNTVWAVRKEVDPYAQPQDSMDVDGAHEAGGPAAAVHPEWVQALPGSPVREVQP